ncbi:hypothetical protein D1007_07123 [Hordeum vulgare]|nr:hypothetical protein D1007_07123 [Hordeum vulgare]
MSRARRKPSQHRGRRLVCGLTPSTSPPLPLPTPMTAEEEEELVRRVMEDSMNTHNEPKREGLQEMIALFAADDVVISVYDAVVKEEAMEGVHKQEEEETTP